MEVYLMKQKLIEQKLG